MWTRYLSVCIHLIDFLCRTLTAIHQFCCPFCRTCWRSGGGPRFSTSGLHIRVWCGQARECVFGGREGATRGGRGGHTDQQCWRGLRPPPAGVPWWADRAHHGGQLSRTLLGELISNLVVMVCFICSEFYTVMNKKKAVSRAMWWQFFFHSNPRTSLIICQHNSQSPTQKILDKCLNLSLYEKVKVCDHKWESLIHFSAKALPQEGHKVALWWNFTWICCWILWYGSPSLILVWWKQGCKPCISSAHFVQQVVTGWESVSQFLLAPLPGAFPLTSYLQRNIFFTWICFISYKHELQARQEKERWGCMEGQKCVNVISEVNNLFG